MYLSFANHYQWTPDQVDAQDPDFIDEALAYLSARAEHDAEQIRKNKPKPKPSQQTPPRRRR